MTVEERRHMIDVPLLRKELEHITAHPDEWDQKVWLRHTNASTCGTKGCLAGNVVLHLGWKPYADPIQVAIGTPLHHVWRAGKDGMEIRRVRDVAREALGLTYDEENVLFASGNTLLEMWLIAEALTDGEIEVPHDVLARLGVTDEALVRHRAHQQGRVRTARRFGPAGDVRSSS